MNGTKFANFEEFMKSRRMAKNSDFTHTSFKGGKYYIQAEEYEEYLKLYQQGNGSSFGIVEFPKVIRYMRFDLDLHFSNNRHYKKYTAEQIYKIVKSIRTEISYYLPVNKKFTIYVLQRPQETEKGDIIKNGLHIQIPEITTNMDHITKIIRGNLISNELIIKTLEEMEVLNPINDVFDECIYEKNGWMQYGSDKGTDNSNAYKVKYYQKDDYLNDKSSLISPTTNDKINYTELFALRNKHNPILLDVNAEKLVKRLSEEENDKEREMIIANEKKKEMIEEAKANRNYDDVVDKDFIKELVGILNPNRVDTYKSWSELGWCLKSIDEGLFELFDKLSQGSGKYDDIAVEKFWNNAKKGNYTMGTLRFWAKQDNAEKYNEICEKYKKYDMRNTLPQFNHDSIAKDFAKRYSDKFLYQDGIMYYFNGVYWEVDCEYLQTLKYIANEYYDELTIINHNKWIENMKNPDCDKDACDELKDKFNTKLLKLKDAPYKANIIKSLKCYVINKDVKLDINPYLFVFKNKVWDLTKGEFIEPNAKDYMTITTGYNYEEDENLDDNIKNVDIFIKQILPDEEVRNCTLKIIASGMCGKVFDKFTIFNGAGGNGKGVLNKLILECFGEYGCKANNVILTEKKTKSDGPNPAKAKLNKKRYVIFTEPDESQRFNCGTLKELTGEATMDGCRQLQKQQDEATLYCTSICECNNKPKITEGTDAMLRRVMDILFKSSFVEDKNDIDEENNTYLMDKSLDTKEWRMKHKIAMFHYLQPYFIKLYNDDFNLHTPQSIKDRNDKYLADSDDIFSWFKSLLDEDCEGYEYIKKTDNKEDFIKIADLYRMFKSSTYFTNLSKKEKRELNKSKFTEKIINIKQFRKVYKERMKIKTDNTDTTHRNILTNYALCNKNSVDEDDEY